MCAGGGESRFAILGPLEVRIDSGEPVALGGLRQQALLAVLALHPNEVVSTDRLVDELWGETSPADRCAYGSGVRIQAAQRTGSRRWRLVTRAPGYVLSIGAEEIDAGRCELLYERARAALSSSRAAEAAALLRDASSAVARAAAQ